MITKGSRVTLKATGQTGVIYALHGRVDGRETGRDVLVNWDRSGMSTPEYLADLVEIGNERTKAKEGHS